MDLKEEEMLSSSELQIDQTKSMVLYVDSEDSIDPLPRLPLDFSMDGAADAALTECCAETGPGVAAAAV